MSECEHIIRKGNQAINITYIAITQQTRKLIIKTKTKYQKEHSIKLLRNPIICLLTVPTERSIPQIPLILIQRRLWLCIGCIGFIGFCPNSSLCLMQFFASFGDEFDKTLQIPKISIPPYNTHHT